MKKLTSRPPTLILNSIDVCTKIHLHFTYISLRNIKDPFPWDVIFRRVSIVYTYYILKG